MRRPCHRCRGYNRRTYGPRDGCEEGKKADTDTAAKWSPHFKFDKDHTLRDRRMVSTFNGTCDCGIRNCTCLLQHCTSSVIAGGSGAASSSAPPSAAAASPEGGGQGRGDEAVSDATSGDGNEPASLPLVGKRSREEATAASEQLHLAVDAQHHERGGGDGSVTRQRRMEEGGARGAVESASCFLCFPRMSNRPAGRGA